MYIMIAIVLCAFYVQVFDDAGNDVTPLPLLQSDPTHPRIPTGHVLADSTVNSVSFGD